MLHFDINETILIGDEAGGDTVDDCLNKIIAKSAFVQTFFQSEFQLCFPWAYANCHGI